MKAFWAFVLGLLLGSSGWELYRRHQLSEAAVAPPEVPASTPFSVQASVLPPLESPAEIAHAIAPAIMTTASVFPIERTLTNRTGNAIAARLLARSAAELQFIRLSDNATFNYPIASLCDEDQRFIRDFPESTLPPLPKAAASVQGSVSPEERRLRASRDEFQRKYDILRLELQKQNSKNPSLPRDEIIRRMDECRNEMISIEQQIIALRGRNP